MRRLRVSLITALGLLAVPQASSARSGDNIDKSRNKCSSFGFEPGTDAFANCVMRLSMQQQLAQPDHETLLRRYRDRSMARRGDDRYPVCTAGMMDNELDTSANKWVGPSCQMAPD